MIRVFDAQQVNRWVERDSGEEVDFSEVMSCDLNVCLAEGDGGAFFMWRGPGIFEVHVFFEQRGKKVIEISHRMLEVMRGAFKATMFWAAVPIESRKVKMFTRLMGWKSQGLADFPHGRCEIFVGE